MIEWCKSAFDYKAKSGANSTVLDKEAEAIIVALQEELIAVRLREAETTESLKELTEKIQDLEEANRRAKEDPNHSVEAMQDELIAVKLREAEANSALKELKQKVNDLEGQWQKQLQRASSNRKQGAAKPTIQTLTEELMSVRLREAEAVAELKEVRQRVMELQTQNQMTSNQMRRIEEERLQLKTELETSAKQKEDLQNRLYEAQKELCKLEARSQEEQINLRLRETETKATVLELKQRIAGLEIKNQELLTKTTLSDSEASQNVQEMQNKIQELHREVSHLKGTMKEPAGEAEMISKEDEDNQEEPQGIDLSVLDSDDDLDKS